jgi:spermidine/putrescine transport system permease protein
MKLVNIWRRSYLAFGYLILYVPLFILIVFSFLDKQHHFTWHWYQVLLDDAQLWTVTGNSLLLAVSAASIATALGTLAAIVLVRYRFIGKPVMNAALMSYIILPDLLVGISLLILLHLFHLSFGFVTLLIGHITLCLPFVAIMINSRLLDIDKRLFEAAKDLGASEFVVFSRIIIPLLITAIIGAWIMCFTLSMDDMIISFFLAGPNFQVLPLYIYSLVRLGITPEINAICSVIFCVTLLLILLAQWGIRKR